MYNVDIMNNIIPISEARSKLPELVDLANTLTRKTYITVKGKVKAALVSADELDSMAETLAVLMDKEAIKNIARGVEDLEAGRIVDWEKMKKELKLE